MPEEIEVKMELEKKTLNTYRYKELVEPKKPPILKTLYIQQFVFGDSAPKNLSVKIEY